MMIDSNKIISKYEKFNDYPIDDKIKGIYENFIDSKVYNNKDDNKDLIALNRLYMAIKIISLDENLFSNKELIFNLKKDLINIQNEDDIEKMLNQLDFKNILKEEKKDLPQTYKLEVCIKFDEKFYNNEKELNEYKNFVNIDPSQKKEKPIEEVFEVFNKLLPWMNIKLYDNEKSYSSLSSGEKGFLNFAINMMYQVDNLKKVNNEKVDKKYNTINLLLDEVEFSLHPEWQKRFVNELLYILNHFKDDFKFNIIFATHSPFILSDIPTQNCIFLKNGVQQKNPFENSNTVGANIHTLLSHGFFMEDGLMGDFAKGKINEIKSFYEKVIKEKNREIFADEFNEKKQKFKNIHSIIGEPFLKTIIGNYLDELDNIFLSNDDKKAKIDEEIKRLQELKGKL